MAGIAIRTENLGKQYNITLHEIEPRWNYASLRDVIAMRAQGMIRRLKRSPNALPSTPVHKKLWALRELSLEIKQGEVVGILGRNGAGKSTLLKLISRVTEPTTGRIAIDGRLASLLEVGAGFHLELTGRENIFLNGAIMGMSRAEIRRQFDSIVAFAEVERFLDTPVKRYSSGMYVRLAFSIAAHMEPDILLVDEVLAVGDAAFQKKCLDTMREVARTSGRTILFVSHDIRVIKELCTRAIWLEQGRLIQDGPIDEVGTSYLKNIYERGFEIHSIEKGAPNRLRVERVILKNSDGQPTTLFHPGESMTVEIHYHAPRRFDHPLFWVRIKSAYGPLFEASMVLDGQSPAYVEGEGVLECTFHHLTLLPQTYFVNIEARAADGISVLVPSQEVGFFLIAAPKGAGNIEPRPIEVPADNLAPVLLPHRWNLSLEDPPNYKGEKAQMT